MRRFVSYIYVYDMTDESSNQLNTCSGHDCFFRRSRYAVYTVHIDGEQLLAEDKGTTHLVIESDIY